MNILHSFLSISCDISFPLHDDLCLLMQRKLKVSGNCYGATRECLHHVLFWQPSHGSRGRGKPTRTYVACQAVAQQTTKCSDPTKHHNITVLTKSLSFAVKLLHIFKSLRRTLDVKRSTYKIIIFTVGLQKLMP